MRNLQNVDIYIKNKQPIPCIYNVKQYTNSVDSFTFFIAKDIIDFEISQASVVTSEFTRVLTAQSNDDYIVLEWVVGSSETAVSGNFNVQVVIEGADGEEWRSYMAAFVVSESVDGGGSTGGSSDTIGYINFASGVIDEGVIGEADEIAREYESFGYVTEGLEYFFDGELKDDTGQYDMGWLNLATGTLHSFIGTETRNDNSFSFDKATYLSLGSDGKYENPTIEVVFKPSAVSSTEAVLVSDYYSAGTRVTITTVGQYMVNVDGTRYDCVGAAVSADNIYTLSGSYDGETVRLVQNGENFEYAIEGSIKQSTYERRIGCMPSGSYYFQGEIYCVRVYNRALSVEEIARNQEIDKERFGVEF